MEEHLVQLKLVLEILKQHYFFIKMSKCEFVQKELEYLKHVISSDGVKVDAKRLKL